MGRALPERPLLKPWYRIARHDDRLVLEYGHAAVVLEGRALERLVPALLPLLDGRRTVDDIVSAAGRPVEAAVRSALTLLAEHELLTEGPPLDDGADAAAALASVQSGLSPAEVLAALGRARAGVAGQGSAAEAVARLLQRSGIELVRQVGWKEDPGGVDVVVVAPTPQELPELTGWNEAALRRGHPWLQVLPFDGRIVAVGPLYLPGETCCRRCYELRRHANLDYREEAAAVETAPASYPSPPAFEAVAAGVAAALLTRWLALRDPSIPGVLLAYEPGSAQALAAHRVYRVPRCPSCSSEGAAAPLLPWFKVAA